MIGHSDFVHPEDQRPLDFGAHNLSRDPYLDLPSKQSSQASRAEQEKRGGLGDVSQLVLATEHSARPSRESAERREAGFGNLNMNLSKMSLGGEKTNTMDFIEKMINQGASENEKLSLKKPIESSAPADDSIGHLLKDFKLPEYDGIQSSLKGPSSRSAANPPPRPDPKEAPYGSSPYSLDTKLLNISSGDLTRKFALGTSGTNQSLGTINLDALLHRQEQRLDRIDRYAEEFGRGGAGGDVKVLAGLDESRMHGAGRLGQTRADLQAGPPPRSGASAAG